jgi:hypothetical protein
MTEHDPLGEAGARLRGAVDPGAFDPDWDAQARARRRSRATVVASVAATLAIVFGGVAVLATGADDGEGGGQVVATAPDTTPDTTPDTAPAPSTTASAPPTMVDTAGSTVTTVLEETGSCVVTQLPFFPNTVPAGWSDEIVAGAGGGSDIPGRWHLSGGPGRHVDVAFGATAFPQSPATVEPITVLGHEGTIGAIHEGYSVEVPTDLLTSPCDALVLYGYGIGEEDLRAFAEGLQPVGEPDALPPAIAVAQQGLLGWWDDGAWHRPADPAAIPAEVGMTYTFVGIGRAQSEAVGGAAELTCEVTNDPPYTIPLEPTFDDAAVVPRAIAVSASWPLEPRGAEQLDTNGATYLEATAAIASDLGVPGSPAHLDQVLRTDLDGDGTDEVLLVGRHPDAGAESHPRAGWYAFVALRSVVDGEVQTDLLGSAAFPEDDDTFPNMTTYRVDAIADLNGDGRMEIVVGAEWWEGWGTDVLEWAGPGHEPDRVLGAGCGV